MHPPYASIAQWQSTVFIRRGSLVQIQFEVPFMARQLNWLEHPAVNRRVVGSSPTRAAIGSLEARKKNRLGNIIAIVLWLISGAKPSRNSGSPTSKNENRFGHRSKLLCLAFEGVRLVKSLVKQRYPKIAILSCQSNVAMKNDEGVLNQLVFYVRII